MIQKFIVILSLIFSHTVFAQDTPVFSYRVVHAYPHDADSFTQGLVYEKGALYESAGQYGESSLRLVDLDTGAVLERYDLEAKYFAEGMTIFNGRIFQITWREQTAFTYSLNPFTPQKTFTYSGEGWGLTTDGVSLIMSDGSAKIVFRAPDTFAATREINVKDGARSITDLNELEWIDGEIWANVWMTDHIARIDPATGQVNGWIDLTGLLPASERTYQTDVLNGIAYDADEGRIFITGKRWPKLYEIEVIPSNSQNIHWKSF
ncbi:MAG: glutaminyl-peptide cyclotransferase [bacterium]|nr:glutaminyl-peptide cyclotransferase [bacterium]